MGQKILVFVASPAILSLVLLFLVGSLFGYTRDAYREGEIIAEVRNKILSSYVENVDPNTLFEGALRGMVSTLDPYSSYLTEDQYRQIYDDIEGEFTGIGVEITIEDGFPTIITPIEDSPAFRAGILAGDKIIEIEGGPTDGITLQEVIQKLRGKKDEKVTIKIVHEGETNATEVAIVRSVIHVKSVKGKTILDQQCGIGYLRMTRFTQNTGKELKEKISELISEGAKSLVLDLRFNAGGLLDTAIEVCDLFLSEGTIVSTKGRVPEMEKEYRAQKDGTINLPLVILVNKGSASASEIVAGSVQDHKRGTIVGTRTYGKGSVQSIIPLKDERTALKLTTAWYYTPSGKSIQRKKGYRGGIVPDVEIQLNTNEMDNLSKWMKDQSIIGKKPHNSNASLDPQIQAAIDILKGKKVPSRQNDSNSSKG